MLVWGPGCVIVLSAYMGGTRGSGVLSSASDVTDWVWALPILEEHGKVGYVSVFCCDGMGGVG